MRLSLLLDRLNVARITGLFRPLLLSLLLLCAPLFNVQAQESELESLRLFYDMPIAAEPKELKPTKPTIKDAKTGSRKFLPVKNATYQYNGFVNTSAGKHFFINGVRLANFKALVLVAAELDGRLLTVKTLDGKVFDIAIGQTINSAGL